MFLEPTKGSQIAEFVDLFFKEMFIAGSDWQESTETNTYEATQGITEQIIAMNIESILNEFRALWNNAYSCNRVSGCSPTNPYILYPGEIHKDQRMRLLMDQPCVDKVHECGKNNKFVDYQANMAKWTPANMAYVSVYVYVHSNVSNSPHPTVQTSNVSNAG